MQIERRHRAFDPDQPRDGRGRWTDGAGPSVPTGPLGPERRIRTEDQANLGVSGDGGRVALWFDTLDAGDRENGAIEERQDRVVIDPAQARRMVDDLTDVDRRAKAHRKRVRELVKIMDSHDEGSPEYEAAAREHGDISEDGQLIAAGSAAGEVGDLHWEAIDWGDGDWRFNLALRPADASDDWTMQQAEGWGVFSRLTPAQFQQLRKEIEARASETAGRSRAYTHPGTPPRPPATGRATTPRRGPAVGMYHRSFALDDIQISRSGDGRTVEAYAAMFDQPYEVRDQHGHYYERIDRAAFNRTLKGAGANAMCLYNHGMTVHGTADAMSSIPLGKPLEIRADGRGLLTVTRYNRGPMTDQVLEAIRNGDITAQSFRGRIVRSSPNGPVPRRRGGDLPTIVRHELGLTDYGPTPIPVNAGAEIVAVRSLSEVLDYVQDLDEDERAELLRNLGVTLDDTTPDTDPGDEDEERPDEGTTATSDDSGPGAEDPPPAAALRSAADIRRRARVAMLTRGML